ncbi:NAD(P)/FAD-dependent oxidoreductase [Desulfobacterota bacterium M19]
MTDLPGAILQRDKETYAIVPRTPAGIVSPEILEKVARTARKFKVPIIKITSGQRLAMVGLRPEDVNPAWDELGMDVGRATELCLHYAQACPGNSVCKFGVGDSLGLAMELEGMFSGQEMRAKIKIGVSGCPMCCAESYMRDVGAFAKKKGWALIVGGNAGGRPRIGDVLAVDLTPPELVRLARRFLEFYNDQARKKERTCRFVERVGIEAVKEAVLGESAGA